MRWPSTGWRNAEMDRSAAVPYNCVTVRAAYPLMLDVSDRLAVIIGGGRVAARKARGLIEAGATKVRMVSPTFHKDVPAAVERIAGRYEPRHLEGAGLAFAATDSGETNDAVVRDARRLGVLVCRADGDHEAAGDFATPAVMRKGALTVVVSAAGGAGPAAVGRGQRAARGGPRGGG